MLDENDVAYRYREYTQEPLTAKEIRSVLASLDVGPRQVLRKNDKVYRELELTGDESDRELVELMATHPTLLQRPIGVLEGQAVVGRPPEQLLDLIEPTTGYPSR